MRVRPLDPPCVFYGTPVGFGTPGNLADIAQKTIGISAIDTVQLFKSIKIGKMMTVKGDMIRPLDFPDPVNGKAEKLIDRGEDIQQNQRNEQGIDNRRKHKSKDTAFIEIA